MLTCKFCGVADGTPDRRGHAAHINRDRLCAPCYYVLERVKYQPEKLTYEDREWFEETCRFNENYNKSCTERSKKLFIPVVQRRKEPKVVYTDGKWHCAKCGRSEDFVDPDKHYHKYCAACADTVRHERVMPPKVNRKTRSDKGQPRGAHHLL